MSADVRVLTVKQPHAYAIAHGWKDVENRPWAFPFPAGTTIALHAGMKVDPDGLRVNGHELPDELPAGVIVALVDVVGCVRDSTSPWAAPGYWHWQLANARRIRPIVCRGQMSLFRPPPIVATQLAGLVAGG